MLIIPNSKFLNAIINLEITLSNKSSFVLPFDLIPTLTVVRRHNKHFTPLNYCQVCFIPSITAFPILFGLKYLLLLVPPPTLLPSRETAEENDIVAPTLLKRTPLGSFDKKTGRVPARKSRLSCASSSSFSQQQRPPIMKLRQPANDYNLAGVSCRVTDAKRSRVGRARFSCPTHLLSKVVVAPSSAVG